MTAVRRRGRRADPGAGAAWSDTRPLQTIVCLPLRSPRSTSDGGGSFPRALGVLYVDNATSAEPFSSDALRAAEALARHAALAIENAQLFEREQHTIEELQNTQKQLLQSEKLATIGQMAAGIAHELNTPLTYIMGNLELLEIQDLTASQREMLSSIARGAERIRSPRPPPARLQPAGPRGDGPARRERRRRAQPGAVPVPGRERPGRARRDARSPTSRASSACRTSSRWRSSTSW